MQDTAVFICRSDSCRDVLEGVLLSVFKHWTDCLYPVSLWPNSSPGGAPEFTPVLAPASNRRNELASKLSQLRDQRLKVRLDDFLVEAPVNKQRVDELLVAFERLNLYYLRLLPLGTSVGERLRDLGKRPSENVNLISQNRPFYSSLQIAFWIREHLLAKLDTPEGIRDFEHEKIDGAAILRSPVDRQFALNTWWRRGAGILCEAPDAECRAVGRARQQDGGAQLGVWVDMAGRSSIFPPWNRQSLDWRAES